MRIEILQLLQYIRFMTGANLKAGRLQAGLTQAQAAARLGISQPYLSQLEIGERPLTPQLLRDAIRFFSLPATVLPLPKTVTPGAKADPDRLARQLAGLGYPGFVHLRPLRANPAAVVLEAVLQQDLEVRLSEALPWVLLTCPDLDWAWLIQHAKLQDVQNRLGFLVSVARELAINDAQFKLAAASLAAAEQRLEPARLVREDTLCRASMPAAERYWLGINRSTRARHWNLLTGVVPEHLPYAS